MRQKVSRAAVAITLCLAWGLGGSAAADTAGGANNVVIAQNTVDGNFFSRSGVMVTGNPTDTVANANLATAESTNCIGCHTVSVAMQVVLVESESPSTVVPFNMATAVNGNCQSCHTGAFAYQYVVQPGRPVALSGSAQRSIADIRLRVDDAAASGLVFWELEDVLRGLCVELASVVTTDLGMVDAPAPSCAESSDH